MVEFGPPPRGVRFQHWRRRTGRRLARLAYNVGYILLAFAETVMVPVAVAVALVWGDAPTWVAILVGYILIRVELELGARR